MVAFTPDHGEMLGNHGMWGKGHCFYDDVLRVPLLLRQPAGVAAGTRSDDLVSLVDLFPTFVTAAGGDRPEWTVCHSPNRTGVMIRCSAKARG